MQSLKTKRILLVFKILLIFFLIPSQKAFSASLNLSPSTGIFSVGDTISVRLQVSSPNESINAISSVLNYSNNTLSLSSISKSGSVISLWPVEPGFSNQNGRATLEGVVLNGYSGNSGSVVTLNFRAIAEGQAYVRFTSGSVLANDGQGTNVLTSSNGSSFTIIKRQAPVEKELKEKPLPVGGINDYEGEKVLVDEKTTKPISEPTPSIFLDPSVKIIIINMALIIVVLVVLLVFLLCLVSKNKKRLKQKVQKTRIAVLKNFRSLENDEEKEKIIIQKLKKNNLLSDDEELELGRFERNIHKAEKSINELLGRINEDE